MLGLKDRAYSCCEFNVTLCKVTLKIDCRAFALFYIQEHERGFYSTLRWLAWVIQDWFLQTNSFIIW